MAAHCVISFNIVFPLSLSAHCVMLFNILFPLVLCAQTVFTRTSNFKYRRAKPLTLAHYQYLARSKCNTAVQCSVACLSTPNCGLADLDSGNLYKRIQAKKFTTQLISRFVEAQKINENVPEAQEINPFTKATQRGQRKRKDDPSAKAQKDESFFMVSQNHYNSKDVFRMSMGPGTKKKIMSLYMGNFWDIVYVRKSNTLFWSETAGIYKQVLESDSEKIKTSNQWYATCLNIYTDKLFYVENVRRKKRTNMYTHDPTKRNSKDFWLSLNTSSISDLVINGGIACWFQCRKNYAVECVNMSTKKNIHVQHVQTKFYKCGTFLAMFKTPNFGMLAYIESDGADTFRIRVSEISAEGQFGEPRTVHSVNKIGQIIIVPGFLVYSVERSNEVQIWETSQNGSIGRKTSSASCTSGSGFSVFVTLF